MHKLILRLITLTVVFIFIRTAANVVEVYPGPGGNTNKTDLYRVEVNNGTTWLESYTYKVARKSVANWHKNTKPSVNFTTFGTSNSVSVRISKLTGATRITAVAISPVSKHITATITNGQAIFTLNPNDKAWVTINGDDANPLFVFADFPKPQVPSGATYYGPGVYQIGLAKSTTNGQTIYLDGGAWLIGTIDLRRRHNVRIMGPGVLSGEFIAGENLPADKTTYHMIIGDASASSPKNNRLENITIVNSPAYNICHGPDYVGGIKILSPWYWSTDGFQVNPGSHTALTLIENCFCFNCDDIFFPRYNYQGNIEVRNCFVSTPNNSVFQMCYWGDTLSHNYTAYLHDIDIKNYLPVGNNALFRASIDMAQNTGVKNMTFENIWIEGDLHCPLIQIENRKYFWPKQSKQHPNDTMLGNTRNIVFRNITVNGKAGPKCTLLGLDNNNGHHDYSFENVIISDTMLTDANFIDYITTNIYTWNVRFIKRQ